MKNLPRFFICTVLFFCLFTSQMASGNGSLVNPRGMPGIPGPFLKERNAVLVVEDGLGMLEMEDIFVNPHHSQIEGVYRFALPEGAFVSSFTYMVDEKNWVDGKIMELNKARLAYNEIVRRQTDPGLLEQSGNELLIKIFPISATAPVHIKFRMHFPVFTRGGVLECELPISPDPVSPKDDDEIGFGRRPKNFPGGKFPIQNRSEDPFPTDREVGRFRPDGEVFKDPSEKIEGKSLPLLKLSGVCRDSRGLQSGSLEPGGTCREENGEISLRLESFDLSGRDITLKLPVKEAGKPAITSFRDNSNRRFRVSRIPGIPLRETITPNPAIIVDSSGSMGGKNIERVEKILDLFANRKVLNENLFSLTEAGLKPLKPVDLKKNPFYGPAGWGLISKTLPAGAFDGIFLITDGEDLSRPIISGIQTSFRKKPLWIILVAGKPYPELQKFSDETIRFVQCYKTDDFTTLSEKLPGILNDLGADLKAQLPDGTFSSPIWGKLSSNGENEAFFVTLEKSPASLKIVDRKNETLMELSDPGEKSDRQAKEHLLLLPAKQRIVTLQRQEQTPQVVAEVTRLGLENNLVTDYTAFLAVPDDVAARFGDVLNPAFLAAFAPPNFKKAREQARSKSCFANQRVILAAIEMYNMDNKDPYKVDPVTCEIDMKKLLEGSYLKSIPQCPSGNSAYRYGPGDSNSGLPFCAIHGYIEMSKKTLEDEFLFRCEKLGLDPVDFEVDFSRFSLAGSAPPNPLKQWFHEMKPLLWFLDLFL